MNKKIVYLVGPMSNVDNYNHDLFNLAEKVLTEIGFVVISPAKLSVGLPYEAYIDYGHVSIRHCDFVYELPESLKSSGATLLKLSAGMANKPVYNNLQNIPGSMYVDKKPFVHVLSEHQEAIDTYRKAIMFNA